MHSSACDRSRHDRSSLSNADWTLLSNVIQAHHTFTSVPQVQRAVESLSALLSSVLDTAHQLSHLCQIITFVLTSIQSWISSTPDFQVLTINEQHSLLQRNLPGVAALHSVLFIRSADIIHHPRYLELLASTLGSQIVRQASRMDRVLDGDATLVKLLLMALAFSSSCFVVRKMESRESDSFLHGTYRLFGSQNVYAELLWKYLLYRYGSAQSVLRFSRLIAMFLDVVKGASSTYADNATYRHVVDNVCERASQTLLDAQNDPKPLWGKTGQ